MALIGISLSSEEHPARTLVERARIAADQGFDAFAVSDHFHPWVDAQGNSPFVWSVLGALAQAVPGSRVGTTVTCPIIRIHPAIIAQAAATAQELCEGRFFLGVGTGEALNEHVLGDPWPEIDIRLEMLREAIELMRTLWNGENVSWHGRYFEVENARIYSLPPTPPPVLVSGFGPKATELAAAVGDGYVNTSPEASAVDHYRAAGGKGPAVAGLKCCWGPDAEACRETVRRLWPSSGLPGQLAQELATPDLFMQAAELVTVDQAVGKVPCGPDPEAHVKSLSAYLDAGYSELYVQQIGDGFDGFAKFYRDQVIPNLP